ncbi:MAG: tetratricopeptide repeat protein [Acidobacteriota bacterium]|nr:tetratricopeptide repeat protein [Acidobacteriota bacterium]
MTSYSRQDVLRILQISARQLQAWERAGLIPVQQTYTFQDLAQLRTVRALREDSVSAASIRDSVVAMRAVAGMANPLTEAGLVRNGARLAFRCEGAVVDPIRRQLLFDFDRIDVQSGTTTSPLLRIPAMAAPAVHDQFIAAVQAEECGEKNRAIELYEQIITREPQYAPAYINLGTLHFHLRQYRRAEELYRRATELDQRYVLAFFDLGNVLDELQRPEESIAAYLRAVELAPRYADAHYNLALAFERKGEPRAALRHWRAYVRIDKNGPWADHARCQIQRLLDRESLSLVWRAKGLTRPGRGRAQLQLVSNPSQLPTRQ